MTAGAYLLQSAVLLAVFLALAWGLVWGARRRGHTPPTPLMEPLGRLALDRHVALQLVRVGERVYLLGTSAAGAQKLDEFPYHDRWRPPAAGPFPLLLERLRAAHRVAEGAKGAPVPPHTSAPSDSETKEEG